jgi:hypothetical protein
MVDYRKRRVLTVMKLLYFVVYIDQRKIHMLLSIPYMPTSIEYSCYTNVSAGMGFLTSISQHLHESLLSEVKLSPIYSILIDEPIDRTCEPHLIVYIYYLRGTGQSAPYIKLVELMPLSRRSSEVMFNCVQELLGRCGLDLMKLVAIVTDGAPCMTSAHREVVACRIVWTLNVCCPPCRLPEPIAW